MARGLKIEDILGMSRGVVVPMAKKTVYPSKIHQLTSQTTTAKAYRRRDIKYVSVSMQYSTCYKGAILR